MAEEGFFRTTVGPRGRITASSAIRKEAGIQEGDQVVVTSEAPGTITVRTPQAIKDSIRAGNRQESQEEADVRRLARLLLDLHRCEHGRLEGDPCLSCGGPSTGNQIIPPGTHIGYTRYGDRIVVPSWRDHNDPKKWVQDR